MTLNYESVFQIFQDCFPQISFYSESNLNKNIISTN